MASESILVVDADATGLKLVGAVLQREGYKVRLACNTEQALFLLQSEPVDLLLVSMDLPGGTAAQIIARARQDRNVAKGVAIGLCVPGLEQAKRTAFQAGCSGCLTKPLDPTELIRSVQYFLAESVVDTPAPSQSHNRLSGKQVALVGFAPVETDRLCEVLAAAGAFGRLFNLEETLASEAVQRCPLILLYIRPDSGVTRWLENPICPWERLVLVGRVDQLLALDPAVQDAAPEFLVDGCRPEEILLRLERMLARSSRPIEIQSAPAPVKVSQNGKRIRTNEILVVDDDPNVRDLVRAVFEKQGIKCRVARNAIEGIQLAKEHTPAAALLDVNMPGMNGFEALPKILAESPDTKVVMLTAREQEADILEGFALGSDDYVVKPFIPQELVARIKRLL